MRVAPPLFLAHDNNFTAIYKNYWSIGMQIDCVITINYWFIILCDQYQSSKYLSGSCDY